MATKVRFHVRWVTTGKHEKCKMIARQTPQQPQSGTRRKPKVFVSGDLHEVNAFGYCVPFAALVSCVTIMLELQCPPTRTAGYQCLGVLRF